MHGLWPFKPLVTLLASPRSMPHLLDPEAIELLTKETMKRYQ